MAPPLEVLMPAIITTRHSEGKRPRPRPHPILFWCFSMFYASIMRTALFGICMNVRICREIAVCPCIF